MQVNFLYTFLLRVNYWYLSHCLHSLKENKYFNVPECLGMAKNYGCSLEKKKRCNIFIFFTENVTCQSGGVGLKSTGPLGRSGSHWQAGEVKLYQGGGSGHGLTHAALV